MEKHKKFRYEFKLKTNNKIASLSNFCEALSFDPQELNLLKELDLEKRYTLIRRPKVNGERETHNPHILLRKIQSRINKRIFKDLVIWPDYLYGSIPNTTDVSDGFSIVKKDYISCAAIHCGAKSILKLDIKNFFDNLHEERVKYIFKNFFHYSNDVVELLAFCCCHRGRTPQGALTSSYLASLCMFDKEDQLVARLHRRGLKYTRLVDDITVSSSKTDFKFEGVIHHINMLLEEIDLPLNLEKTCISRVSMEPLTVHGLRVNFSSPRLQAKEVADIRSSVSHLRKNSARAGARTTLSYRKAYYRVMGKISKLKRVGHKQHEELLNKIKEIFPLSNKKEKEYIEKSIASLEKGKGSLNGGYFFERRIHTLYYKLSILQKSFPKEAALLRERLGEVYEK